MTESRNKIKVVQKQIWSRGNESTCLKLAKLCREQIDCLMRYVRWMKRFSLACSLATSAIAATSATTTLLVPSDKFSGFKEGVSSFLYFATFVAGVPKALKIPSRIHEISKAIGEYSALESRIYHEMGLNVASDREDVSTFIQSSYQMYNRLLADVKVPRFLNENNTGVKLESSQSLKTRGKVFENQTSVRDEVEMFENV